MNSTLRAIRKQIAAYSMHDSSENRVIGRLNTDDRRRWLAKAHMCYFKMGFRGQADREARLKFTNFLLSRDWPAFSTDELCIAEVRALGKAMDAFPEDILWIKDYLEKESTSRSGSLAR